MDKPEQSNKEFLILIFVAFFSYGVTYIFNLVLSHTLPHGLYGDFTVGLRTLSIFSFIVLLGTASSAKRFLSQYLTAHDNTSSLDYMHWNLTFILRSSGVFLLLLAGLLITIILLHLFQIKHIASYHLAIYLLFITPLSAFTILIASYLECNNNIVLYNLVNNGKYVLFVLVMLGLVHFFHPIFNNAVLWIFTLIVFCLLMVIEAILANMYLPKDIINMLLNCRKLATPIASSAWKKTSLKLVASQLIYLVISTVDLYAVKLLTHGAMDTSQYSAILTVGNFTQVVTSTIFSSIVPMISFYLKNNDLSKLQQTINRSNVISLTILSCTTLTIIYFSHYILNLFGPGYATHTSVTALTILMIGYYCSMFACSSIQLLSDSENSIWLIHVSVIEIIVITITALMLVPRYGIIGAALASAISLSLSAITYIFIVRWKMKIKSFLFV